MRTMEASYIQAPPSQRSFNSPASHYDDDDILSSSSYNIQASNPSGSTITFEPSFSGPSASMGQRQRVRDMVKLFEAVTPSSGAPTPTPRANSTMFANSKPHYNGAVRGNINNTFSGSQASVKQHVSQFQEADAQFKSIEKSQRCVRQYTPPFQRNEEQSKTPRYSGGGVSTAIATEFGSCNASQSISKPFVQPQFKDADVPIKITERCPRCNVLYRCDEVHYCLGNKKVCGPDQSRILRDDMDNNAKLCNKSYNALKLGSYSGFADSRSNHLMSSPSKVLSETCGGSKFEGIDGVPVSLAYDSKTTILRTHDGVRIVVDIAIDSMANVSPADVICSRVETEMPHSRILTEFQQKTAMIMAGEDGRL